MTDTPAPDRDEHFRPAKDQPPPLPPMDDICPVVPEVPPPPPIPPAAAPVDEGTLCYCLRCQHELRPDRLHGLERPRCPECRLPYNPYDPATYRTRPAPRGWKFLAAVFAMTFMYATLSYTALFYKAEFSDNTQLGAALFLAVPFAAGATLGYFTRISLWLTLLLSLFLIPCLVLGLLCMSIHGLFCGATLAGIFVGPALLGAFTGWLLRIMLANWGWDRRRYIVPSILFALPFGVDLIERHVFPAGIMIAEVRTAAVFPAPPEQAWDSILFYEQVEHEPPLLLKLELPRPVRAEGSKAEVGDVQRCVYRKGHLVKVITRKTESRELAFRVTEQTLHFEHDVRLLDGAFLLEPLPDGQTRVVLTTRYERLLRPAWLWQDMEEKVVHTLHGHVLEGMRRRLEKPEPEGPSPELKRAPIVRR